MKLTRQAKLVRDHLYSAPHLTSWQAEGVYRIRRLASRVSELKNAGYDIEKTTTEDATGQRYTRYAFTRQQRRTKRPLNPPVQSSQRFTLAQIEQQYRKWLETDAFCMSGSNAEEAAGFVKFLAEGEGA